MPYFIGASAMAPLTLRPSNNRLDSSTNHFDNADDIDMDVEMNDELELRREQAARLAAKNRRKRYLELHPEYFDDSSLELADPLLYDRLIRRFQTASEREAEGRRKGFTGVMHTDLWRAEAKKDALSRPNPNSLFTYTRGSRGEILEEEKDDVPMDKGEGKAWWIDDMTQRFLRGEDQAFDYKTVDSNEKYDDPEQERDIQEAYFDSMESDFDTDGEGKEKILTGETGIQDY